MTTADWDFSGSNWSLDTTYYVSSPSSLAITPTASYTSLTGFIKTSVVPNSKVREGRYITQFRVCGLAMNVTHLKFFFRYQDANNYYLVDIYQVTSPGGKIEVVRMLDGVRTVLGGADDPNWPRWLCWAVGGWDAVRITWTEDAIGRLVIKVEKLVNATWTAVADVIDPNNYWASVGGRVGWFIDSYNNSTTNLDDGEIWGYF